MTYDFPLRRDFMVRITLPLDLTPGEAERLGSFLRALPLTQPLVLADLPSLSVAADHQYWSGVTLFMIDQ